jgi:dolichol-phosphate mannosyltransferase
MRKVLVITPTYNEKENINTLVSKIFELQKKINNWEIHLLVVDSRSPDQTAFEVKKLQKKYPLLYLLETEKKGLGNAYIQGYQYAFEKINPYLIIQMDADLSHQPEYILNFLKEIEKGADFVLGSRYIKNGSIPKEWAWYRKLFSFFGNLIIRIGFANFKITDWTSGYRAIKSWVIKEIRSETKKYSGYVFQIATIDQALKKNARIIESPIKFIDRRHGKSKINFSQYIFQILLYIIKNSSFVRFLFVGTLGFIIDFGLSYILIEKKHFSIRIATIISTETAIISNFIFNNFWSFSHKKLSANDGKFLIGLIKFNLVSIGSILIQAEGINLLAHLFGKKWWYIYKILIIVFLIIPYSFILYNKLIWRKK